MDSSPTSARVSDLHVGPVHGGGPVLGPGCPTVFIGGQPAARVGDTAACAGGAVDTIIQGSATVFIGGMPAARSTDVTAHGGVLGPGCPTVFIGGSPVMSFAISARAALRPTSSEMQQIQLALASGHHQLAIDLTIAGYGIDVSNVPGGPRWDPTESNYGTTRYDGSMQLGPAAFASQDVLASTIVHETTHANQAAGLRAQNPAGTDWPSGEDAVNYDEAGAYQAELHSAANTGLSSDQTEYELAASRRSDHYDQLSAPMRSNFDRGKYPP